MDRPASLDLGGRVLDCIASPGHDATAVTFYDPYTGFLLTGDTAYPGRLYVEDWVAFGTTIDRLIAFAESHPVTHVLGCHVEMSTTPGVDYPIRTVFQPAEHPLEMTVDQLRYIRHAIGEIGDRPGRYVYPEFVIHHERSRLDQHSPRHPGGPPAAGLKRIIGFSRAVQDRLWTDAVEVADDKHLVVPAIREASWSVIEH